MNKIVFVGLLSLITINFLSADEYISDAYLEEISAQEELVSEPVTTSESDVSLETLPIAKTIEEEREESSFIIEESLPITKTVEEEAEENRKIVMEETLPIVKTIEEEGKSSVKKALLLEENNTVVTKEISPIQDETPSSPYLEALKKARAEHKIVMIFIRATHCKYCDKMEKETLSDSSVKDELEKNFVTVYYNQDIEPLPLGFQKGITPNFIFVDADENILNQYPGLKSPLGFKGVLAEILSM